MTKSHTVATLQTIVNLLEEFTGHAQDPEFLRRCHELGVTSPADYMSGVALTIRHIRNNYLPQPSAAPKRSRLRLAVDNTKHQP